MGTENLSIANMSDDEWDADGFEPKGVPTDKWDGEDEDDDIKDAWDKSDSEEDKSKGSNSEETKVKAKPKKKLAEKIAEREALKQKELEARQPLTEEQKLAEKLRLQKLEEKANIEHLRDMCGIKENKIDGLVPVTKEDFEQFGKAISEKIQMFSTSEHYSDLIENITKEICVNLNIESLHSAKLKEEKALKSGKKSVKGKSVKMDLDKDLYGGSIGDGFDDMDDFM